MGSVQSITEWIEIWARRTPHHVAALEARGGSITYEAFVALATSVGHYVAGMGVQPGDCVLVVMRKGVDVLVAWHGVLRCGATYVPADTSVPAARIAFMARDCDASSIICDEEVADAVIDALEQSSHRARVWRVPTAPRPGTSWRIESLAQGCVPTALPEPSSAAEVAFLLYTSGTTGTPKAVPVTHDNVVAFIDWCSSWVKPTTGDRFAAHAPLHFSLSVFNVYLPWKHGGLLVLMDEAAATSPALLAPLIEQHQITIWFSTPTILVWLTESGVLPQLGLHLRLIMFAGESFHVNALKRLMTQVPAAHYVHVLGSTETHMITRYDVPAEAELPPRLPAGNVADHFEYRIVDEQLRNLPPGAEGELLLRGAGVMRGYWRRPTDNDEAFVVDPEGRRWYRTRDIVKQDETGCLTHLGRRDRMVKKRGNRVELGEIEACLATLEGIREVAVVARDDAERGMTLRAFVVAGPGQRPSAISLKAHCASRLPSYMVPDVFAFPIALPRTLNGKVDFPQLQALR